MNKQTVYKLFILIIGLTFAVAFLMRSCDKPQDTILEVKTIYIRDTIEKVVPDTIEVPKPYPVYVDVPVLIPVDTAQILKDYFTVWYSPYEYMDTNLHIKIYDSITQNFIKHRHLEYQIYYLTKETIRTVEKKNSFLMVNLGVGNSIQTTFLYKPRNSRLVYGATLLPFDDIYMIDFGYTLKEW